MGFLRKLGLRKARDGRTDSPLYGYWKQMMETAYDRTDRPPGEVHRPWWDFWQFAEAVEPLFRVAPGTRYFCRLDCSRPWAPGNVHFTDSPAEAMAGRRNALRVEVDGQRLGIHALHERLKADGVVLTKAAVRERIRLGRPVLAPRYAGMIENIWNKLDRFSHLRRPCAAVPLGEGVRVKAVKQTS